MRCLRFAGLIGAILLMHAVSVASAETNTGKVSRTLSVSGTGMVMAIPDIVRISAGVETQAQSAGGALAGNTAAMSAAFELLLRSGIAQKDLQTSNFSISPQYYRGKDNAQPAAIIGYRVSNQLNVTVRNVASLGGILDALVRQGVNNINNVGFSVSKPQPKMDMARQKAMEDARRKALLYANAAGVKLGKVMTISEQGGYVEPSPRYAARAMAASAGPVPIAGGEHSLRVNVTVSWILE